MTPPVGPSSNADGSGRWNRETRPVRTSAVADGAHPSHRLFAALYDPVTAVAERTLFREHREFLAADLSGAVLDLGAGTGATFPYFDDATERAAGVTVHAVEPDPHMRRRARRRAAALDLDVHFVGADATSLPYRDDALDVVVASFVFCTVPDVEGALSEVARVLASDGEFRFFEHVRGRGRYGRVQDAVAPAWKLAAAGCRLNRETGEWLREHPAFEVADFERFSLPVPLVTPFVRGRLVPRESASRPRRPTVPAGTVDRPDER